MYAIVKFLVVMLVFSSSITEASVLDSLQPPQNSELVDSTDSDQVKPHLVVLGALEKINHELEPEQSTSMVGRKSSRTYYLPLARKTSSVVEFYRDQLSVQGEIAFECRGRTCGSSSYWANKILGRSILYGPEQFQHYVVYQLPADSGYLAVYVGQRATRKIYVHIEAVSSMATGQADE